MFTAHVTLKHIVIAMVAHMNGVQYRILENDLAMLALRILVTQSRLIHSILTPVPLLVVVLLVHLNVVPMTRIVLVVVGFPILFAATLLMLVCCHRSIRTVRIAMVQIVDGTIRFGFVGLRTHAGESGLSLRGKQLQVEVGKFEQIEWIRRME